jgi:hypothetical protein
MSRQAGKLTGKERESAIRALSVFICVSGIITVPGCTSGSRPSGLDGSAGCPSVDQLRALHAATFQLEHGSTSEGRVALAQARALLIRSADATAGEVLKRLERFELTADSDPNRAASELEQIRLTFSVWSCLPDSLHQQFHAALPPISARADGGTR